MVGAVLMGTTVCYHEERFNCWPLDETALWTAVIRQALYDATAPTPSPEREEARAWLTKRSEDFELVAELAGLNADALLDKARLLAYRWWWRVSPEWRASLMAHALETKRPPRDVTERNPKWSVPY